jgi:hypothetical protein
MFDLIKKISVAYFAGAVGGAGTALVSWLFGHPGVVKTLSVQPVLGAFAWPGIAGQLLVGSLWALMFVPLALVLRVRGVAFGVLASLVPIVYLLFVHYPHAHHGAAIISQAPQAALTIVLGYVAWGLLAGSLYISQYRS